MKRKRAIFLWSGSKLTGLCVLLYLVNIMHGSIYCYCGSCHHHHHHQQFAIFIGRNEVPKQEVSLRLVPSQTWRKRVDSGEKQCPVLELNGFVYESEWDHTCVSLSLSIVTVFSVWATLCRSFHGRIPRIRLTRLKVKSHISHTSLPISSIHLFSAFI